MPNPLSADIRARFQQLFDEGLTGHEIGRRLMISVASASVSGIDQALRRMGYTYKIRASFELRMSTSAQE